jgi:hypothetical protein
MNATQTRCLYLLAFGAIAIVGVSFWRLSQVTQKTNAVPAASGIAESRTGPLEVDPEGPDAVVFYPRKHGIDLLTPSADSQPKAVVTTSTGH